MGDDLLLNLAYDSRIASNQELVRRFFNMRKEVVSPDNGHMVDARFQFRILIRADAGDQRVRRIGDKIQPLILIFQDHVIDGLGAVHRKRLVVYDFFGLAVDFGSWFGGQKYAGFIRINLATSRENIEILLDRLALIREDK